MWKDHSEFKRCLSSETQALNEKVQEEIQQILWGQEYDYMVFDSRINFTVQLGLYQSLTKQQSRVKSTKVLKGYQLAVKLTTKITDKGREEDVDYLLNFNCLSNMELYTEQSQKTRRKLFKFGCTSEESQVVTFDNVGILKTDNQLVLHISLDLKNLFNRPCGEYAGLVNHGILNQ